MDTEDPDDIYATEELEITAKWQENSEHEDMQEIVQNTTPGRMLPQHLTFTSLTSIQKQSLLPVDRRH